MGRAKQLLPLRGRPLLQRVLDEAIASRLDEVVLVLGHRADEIREALALPEGRRVRAVVNADWARGQSTTLRLALRSTSPTAAAAAILLGDQPGVEAALIDRVAKAFLDSGLPAARPVYSAADGSRVPGHPVLLARRIWSEVDKLGGDEGARGLLAARADWLLQVPVEGEPPADIDTWEDYRRAGGVGPTGRS
jgi:molybdenum cofactor cytidylyltransferase